MNAFICEQCGGAFEARRKARFCGSSCRTKAWKARNGYSDPRRRSERRATTSTPRKPDLRISYRRAIHEVSRVLNGEFATTAQARIAVYDTLTGLLTDRQRKAL